MSMCDVRCSIERLEVRRLLAATDPDTSFGTGGKALLDHVVDSADYVNVMALTPDNKLIVGGRSDTIADAKATLAKYNLDGSLDPSFGQGGKERVPVQGDFADLVVNSDGSITTLSSSNNSSIPLMNRYTSTGALDSTFTIGVSGMSGTPTDLEPTGSKFYLVVGNNIARINANGSADTFGTNGVLAIASEPNFVQFKPQRIAALSDGSFIVGGTYGSTSSGTKRGAFRHYSAAGVLDTTFGSSGTLQLNSLSTNVSVGKLTLLPSGKMQAVVSDNFQQGYVVRFSTSGLLDSTWGTSGLATPNPSTTLNEGVGDVVLDSNSRLLGVGVFRGSTIATAQEFLFRMTSTGTIDTTFGMNGYVQGFTDSGQIDWGNYQLALPGNGFLYHATGLEEQTSGPTVNQYLYRFNATSGALDTSFGTGGSVITSYLASADQLVTGAALLSDGGVAFVGNQTVVSKSQMIVGRLTDTGQPATFGQNGSTEINFGTFTSVAYDVEGQSDGKLLVVGRAETFDGSTRLDKFALARLNVNGSLDPNFGTGGEVTSGFSNYTYQTFAHVAVDNDGNIYGSGVVQNSTVLDGVVIRYTSTGQLDNSFGSGGLAMMSVTGKDVIDEIIPLANGQMLVAGDSEKSGSTSDDAFLIRLNHNGTTDTSFGTNGAVTFDINSTSNEIDQMAVDPAGRIYTLSYVTSPSSEIQLRRYTAAGQLDPSFGTAGIATFANLTGISAINDMKLSGSGKLLVVGRTSSSPSDAFILAYNTDGTAVTTFGSSGKAVIDISGSDAPSEFFVRPDGKWVLTARADGTATTLDDFAAMRLAGEPLDVTSPTMSAIQPVGSRPQVQVTFSEKVSPPTSANVTLVSRTSGNTFAVPQSWLSYNSSSAVLTISPDATLPDDNYQLQIASGSAIDFSGNRQANSFNYDFFFLRGDANGDRVVNALDFNALATNYSKPGTFSQGDFDFSGTVNSGDFDVLAARFGKYLAPASGAGVPMLKATTTANLFATIPIDGEKSVDDDVLT